MNAPKANHPDKQAVRDYLGRLIKEKIAPPSPEEMRRALGWGLLNKSAECAR